jgi:hypothetical protein
MYAYHPHNLQTFVDGRLSEAEVTSVLGHLAVCEECLAAVDWLWAKHPTSLAGQAIPELDATTAKRLEDQVVRRIQRSDLLGMVVYLGTAGLINTSMTMLRPMFDAYLEMLDPLLTIGQPVRPRGEKDD